MLKCLSAVRFISNIRKRLFSLPVLWNSRLLCCDWLILRSFVLIGRRGWYPILKSKVVLCYPILDQEAGFVGIQVDHTRCLGFTGLSLEQARGAWAPPWGTTCPPRKSVRMLRLRLNKPAVSENISTNCEIIYLQLVTVEDFVRLSLSLKCWLLIHVCGLVLMAVAFYWDYTLKGLLLFYCNTFVKRWHRERDFWPRQWARAARCHQASPKWV